MAFRRRLQQSHSLALAQAQQANCAALQAAASPTDSVPRQALKVALAAAGLQVTLHLWVAEGTRRTTCTRGMQLSPTSCSLQVTSDAACR